MSDDPKPEIPEEAAPPSATLSVPEPGAAGQTPDLGTQSQNPGPQVSSASGSRPIDYALPSHKKSWLPTPALIRNLGCLVKLIAGFTILLALGYFALVALNPKARQWALQGSKAGPGGAPPSGKGPTPFKALNQLLAIPAQAIGKTDDVVKANNARVGVLDGVIKEEEGKARGGSGSRHARGVADPFARPEATTDKKATALAAPGESAPQAVPGSTLLALAEKRGAPIPDEAETPDPKLQPAKPSAAPAPDTPNEMKLAGDIVITQASPEGTPRASAAFFYSIVKLNVSGITQGKPARALINNRLTYEGDEINRALGITFAELDAATKRLVFKDKSGAIVTRSY